MVVLRDAFVPEFAEAAHRELLESNAWANNEKYFADGCVWTQRVLSHPPSRERVPRPGGCAMRSALERLHENTYFSRDVPRRREKRSCVVLALRLRRYGYKHHNMYDQGSWSKELRSTLDVFTSAETQRFMSDLTGRDCRRPATST